MIIFSLLLTFIMSIIITPFVIKLAKKIGATDAPDERKVHDKIMPRLGGLGIYISFLIGVFIFIDDYKSIAPILIGSLIIVLTGFVDDLYTITPKVKLFGQLLAALVTVIGGVRITYVTIPIFDRVEFGLLAIPVTIIWIIAITNAINLIDGLDGLAAGISSIALITISILSIIMANPLVALLGTLLLGSTLGFLVFNFHPAKIFMGDTGSLLLGYLISIFSIMGLYKNVTILSLIVPVIILAVPIIDTLFAIIRRWVNKKPLSSPDKMHLHHRLIHLGYSHKQTVLLIYLLSTLFSIAALLFTRATMWGSILIIVILLIIVETIVEITGLINENYKPFLTMLSAIKKYY